MKKILFGFLILISFPTYSQSLKLNAGVALTNLDWEVNNSKLFNSGISTFTGSVGIDYLKKKTFCLSTNVGYLQKGGQSEITYTDNSGNIINTAKTKAQLNYITLNTYVKIKYPTKSKTYPFLALGVYGGYLISESKTIDPNNNFEKINSGAVLGLGITHKILKNEFGIEAAFFGSLSFGSVS
jgi:hypothetical protein